MNKTQNERRLEKLTLYFPMVAYFIFMLLLLALRSYPIYWLTGNEYYYPVSPTRGINVIPFSTIVLFVPMGIFILQQVQKAIRNTVEAFRSTDQKLVHAADEIAIWVKRHGGSE